MARTTSSGWMGLMALMLAATAFSPTTASADDDPMAGIGVGIKAGYLFYGKTEYEYVLPTDRLPQEVVDQLPVPEDQPARGAPTVSLALFLGDGLGLAWDTEAYLMFDDSLVIGGYTGPAFRFPIKRLYISVGAGLRVGYLTDDAYDLGLDLYGRIPIRLTYYVTDAVGIMAEFGFGYGGTGIKPDVNPNLVPEEYRDQVSVELGGNLGMQFAKTGTFDGSLGLRFP